MANELLDFVMSLVRDPDAAARYAADPGQAIADAHLTGVTSADVGNLLPMVSESLAMSTPLPPPISAALAPEGSHVGGSVWTSGAATAAFDAFTPHTAGIDDPGTPVIEVRHLAVDTAADPLGDVDAAVSTQLGDPLAVLPAHDDAFDGGSAAWHHAADWSHGHVDPGFDHFA